MNREKYKSRQIDISVSWEKRRQPIDGFGFTQEEECTFQMEEPARSQVMDMLFSRENGAGFSLLRTEVGCGESRPTIEPEQGVWREQGDPRELWYYREALERGAEQIYGTVWTPPKWMKNTGEWYRGGKLRRECYQDFADYLARYVKLYREAFGLPMYGVAPANEPRYAARWKSCVWTGEEIREFVTEYLCPVFRREKLDAAILLGENAFWSDRPVRETLCCQEGRDAVEIVTAHQYMGWVKPLKAARAAGKRVWCSELCQVAGPYRADIKDAIRWAARVHRFLTVAEVSAFFYWRGAHTANSNETLIRINSPSSFTVPKRLYALGHFSRFIRPGWVRVDVSAEHPEEVLASAYSDTASGRFAVVFVHTGTKRPFTIRMQLGGCLTATSYVTDSGRSLQPIGELELSSKTAQLRLEPQSIVTLSGERRLQGN